MVIECIKEGFALVNRNLQLVVIRIVFSVINLVSLSVFLGVPMLVAIMYLGLDLAQARELIPFLLKNPLEFVYKYLGLIFLFFASVIFYMIFMSLLFLYVLSGTVGVLKNAAVNVQYRFSLSSFFKEARMNFSRLFWLVSLVLLIVIVLFLALMVSGGIFAGIVQAVTESESTIETFLTSFAMLTIATFGILIVLSGLIVTVYSVVTSVVEAKGVRDALGKTFALFKEKPQALLVYLILFAGIILASSIFYGLQVTISFLPFMAPLLYVMNAFFHGYAATFVWSSLVVYYIRGTNYPVSDAGYEI